MNSDASRRTTTETPIAIRTALSTWSRSAAVREAASSTPLRLPTETGIATNVAWPNWVSTSPLVGALTSAKPAKASASASSPGLATLASRSVPSA